VGLLHVSLALNAGAATVRDHRGQPLPREQNETEG
jgi:hypothetical protein